MIKHIVCFKLKDKNNINEAKELLLSMNGKVPMMRDIFVGCDVLHSQRSYDIILEVLLDDMKALDEYQNDPYHAGVVKTYLVNACESMIALDCEIQVTYEKIYIDNCYNIDDLVCFWMYPFLYNEQ